MSGLEEGWERENNWVEWKMQIEYYKKKYYLTLQILLLELQVIQPAGNAAMWSVEKD